MENAFKHGAVMLNFLNELLSIKDHLHSCMSDIFANGPGNENIEIRRFPS